MPLYEYRCEACGAKEERLQSYSAPTIHDCPKCGLAEAMRREISRTAFVLSGNGWYAGGYGGSEKPLAEGSGAPKNAAETHDGEVAVKKVPAAKTDPGVPPEPKAACASGCACHSPKIEAITKLA